MAIIPNDEKFIGLSASVDTTERRSALINAESQAYTMQDITDTVAAGMPPATNPDEQYVPLNFGGEFADSPISVSIPPIGYYGWSTLATQVGSIISVPPGVDQTNVAPYLPLYGLKILNNPVIGTNTIIGDYQTAGGLRLNVIGDYPANPSVANSLYVDSIIPGANSPFWIKGDGTLVQIGQQYSFNNTNIYNGIISDSSVGTLKMNCGITSPNEGFFNASGAAGTLTLGVTDSRRFGIEMYGPSIRIGSSYMSGAPSSPASPILWARVTDESGSSGGPFLYLPLYM